MSYFRYVNALANPALYLQSENNPDVCVLFEKAADCISSEIVYEWYDHFEGKCQNWPVVHQTTTTASAANKAANNANHKNKKAVPIVSPVIISKSVR